MLLLGMPFLVGCDKDPDPTSSGGGGDVSGDVNLTSPTVSPTDFVVGETAVVEVTATDAGSDPIDGLSIDFVVSPSAGGYFTPPTVTTNANGIASTVFTSSQTGTMSIGAQAEGANSTYTNINVSSSGQQSSGNMTIGVSPSLLTADGASTATVTITVEDAGGNPAPDQTLVLITAGERFDDVDGDGYFSANDSLMIDYNANDTWDPVGFISATAMTDATGTATVTYTAGTDATTAYIKATVNGTVDFDGSVETSIQLTPDADIYAIELSTDVSGLQVRHTGGIETTNLEAICYDVHGNFVPEGLAVNFVITNGPDGGENIAGQGWGPVTAYTNSNGVATVPLWSGTISGTMRLYASAGTVLSSATFVTVYAGPPYYMAVGSDFCNMDAWNTVNRVQYVNTAISDIYHNPVQDSVVVYFTVDEGIIDAYGITEDSTGVASAIFRTGEPQVDGIVWVWAETSGGTVVGSTFFYNSYIPAAIFLSVLPNTLLANGETEATFWADVRDLNDNYVINGTEVESKATYGSATSGGTVDGCRASIYEGTYRSAILKEDFSVTGGDDDGIGAIDVVTVKSGFVANTFTVILTTAYAFHEESEISVDAASVPYGATNLPIRAIIKDRYGNPLADHTLTATISNGSIVGGTAVQETNGFGEAFGFQFNAPPDASGGSSAIITITDSDPRGPGLTLTASVSFTAKK
jgi:adhesin/invasin